MRKVKIKSSLFPAAGCFAQLDLYGKDPRPHFFEQFRSRLRMLFILVNVMEICSSFLFLTKYLCSSININYNTNCLQELYHHRNAFLYCTLIGQLFK